MVSEEMRKQTLEFRKLLDCCVLASSGVSYRYGQMLFGE